MRHLYLASASPRRAELLAQIGVAFARLPAPDIDESPLPGEPAQHYVERLAREKAYAGWLKLPDDERRDAVVLGADTCVVVDDRILGKPADADEAVAMLRQLSGREHTVMTAVCLWYDTTCLSACPHTRVRFATLGESLIQRYVASAEPYDKAGGYGIQGLGAVLVAEIQGSYSGVVGLPLHETALLLQQAGVNIWQAREKV